MCADLAEVFARTIAALDPAEATARALPAIDRRVWIAAAGKAARAMAAGAMRELGARVAGGLVVSPTGGGVPAPLVEMVADHPVPGPRSEAAGRALLALAASIPADDVLLALISGGASSLAAVPAPGLTLVEKVARVQAAVSAGAPIAEVNALRTSLSAIKGGRLAAACPAPVITIVISDVVGDDPAIVGSGPTVPCARLIVASGIADLARAAAHEVRGTIVDAALVGDVEEVATRIASAIAGAAPGAMVWTGEPTIRVGAEPGRGGRMRHVALLVARALRGRAGWKLLAAGSDGVDGTSDAAGAIVDGATWERIVAAGIDPDRALEARDSGTALAAVGDALVTGPTGVNHADLLVACVDVL